MPVQAFVLVLRLSRGVCDGGWENSTPQGITRQKVRDKATNDRDRAALNPPLQLAPDMG
jgi:hypothetical protein